MADKSFFDAPTEKSLVKIEIVSKYFPAWARIIIPQAKKRNKSKIGYADLFSGPGRYENGTESTPVLILKQAINNPDMAEMLVTIFNDGDKKIIQNLEETIYSIPGITKLKNQPKVRNFKIGKEIDQTFQEMTLFPTLFFIDPFGFKGLSLELINSSIKAWGCECIFYFDYNDINRFINNNLVEKHINLIFGEGRTNQLREEIKGKKPEQRELMIVQTIFEALQEIGGSYVQQFCFKKEDVNRTSHYLIFVTKNPTGHKIMKEIMGKLSSDSEQGVPSFEYSPAKSKQLSLFDQPKPLDALEDMLLDEFAGQTITMKEIYNQHNVGRSYIEKNYKDALKNLEQKGKITVDPPASQRPKRNGEVTFADKVKVTFPPKQ
ncbi:MAG TPA: three-Cys-motif partner protein TcmP [Nostocaceae cyanobacterium]|nr:three-Cys-motif partner protein TcmP [Nostocaceae cyanobacterium]